MPRKDRELGLLCRLHREEPPRLLCGAPAGADHNLPLFQVLKREPRAGHLLRQLPTPRNGKKGMLPSKIGAVEYYYSSRLFVLRGQGAHYYCTSLRGFRIQREPDSDTQR